MNYIGDENIKKQFYECVSTIADSEEFIKAYYLQARHDEVRNEIINGIKNGTIIKKNDIRKITIKQSPGYKAGLIGESYFQELDEHDE